jgi:hypothetical protein
MINTHRNTREIFSAVEKWMGAQRRLRWRALRYLDEGGIRFTVF